PQRLQSPQPRMKTEVAVEIDSRSVASIGTRNGQARPQRVVRGIGMRHNYIQAIDRPALENRNQDLLVSRRCGFRKCRPAEPRRRPTHAEHCERGTLQKNSSGWHAFTPCPLPLLKFR